MQQGNPTSLRVPDPGIAPLFDQDARWQAWLDVEAAMAMAEAALGMIPAAAAEEQKPRPLSYADMLRRKGLPVKRVAT